MFESESLEILAKSVDFLFHSFLLLLGEFTGSLLEALLTK
jgi:hypothetical protein